MKRIGVWAVALVALTALEAAAQQQEAVEPLSQADQAYLEETYRGSLAEIQYGRLAQVMSRDPAFKNFGTILEEDHTRLSHDLEAVAHRHGLSLLTRVGPENQSVLSRLMAMRDADFEVAFKARLVSDHEEQLELARHVADEATLADVSSLANRTIPIFEKHLSMARNLVPGRTVLHGETN